MKRYRKTRKSGGADVVFICKTGRSANDKCIEDFENEMNFIYQDVPPDGNCFFHTLELYYKLNGNTINMNYKDLRAIVISYIFENYNQFAAYGINQEDIFDLSNDGAWDSDAGDIVIPAAAAALNIQIMLYDLKPGTKNPPTKKRIILHTYPEIANNSVKVVNIIRINKNHFGLLIPSTPNNIISMMRHMSISNKSNKAITRKNKKYIPTQNSSFY